MVCGNLSGQRWIDHAVRCKAVGKHRQRPRAKRFVRRCRRWSLRGGERHVAARSVPALLGVFSKSLPRGERLAATARKNFPASSLVALAGALQPKDLIATTAPKQLWGVRTAVVFLHPHESQGEMRVDVWRQGHREACLELTEPAVRGGRLWTAQNRAKISGRPRSVRFVQLTAVAL